MKFSVNSQLLFAEDAKASSPLSRLSLPKDQDLPVIIREIVTNAPPSRKLPAFITCLVILCALCPQVRVKYYYDRRESALLLHVFIEGAQSSGKSFTADIESLLMNDTLKARDREMRRIEQDYREKKKRRKANEKLEEEPKTTIRVVPPTISKTVLTKRADMFMRVYGISLPFWMYSEELAQVTDAGKNGYSNLQTIMRSAFDYGSEFGIDFASDNSYSAIVDINICALFCATPAALDEYFDKKAIEGGNITRTILCKLEDNLGDDGPIFTPYTPEQQASIQSMLQRLMSETYNDDGSLKQTVWLDMSWLDKTVCNWVRKKGNEAALSGSLALDVFRKRSSVSAYRSAALCQYLYLLESNGTEREETIHRRVKQIYLFMAEYILQAMLSRWGKQFEELNSKREQKQQHGPKERLFDLLPDTFTREQLNLLIEKQGKVTPDKVFINRWKKIRVIEILDKNTFRKLRKEADHD